MTKKIKTSLVLALTTVMLFSMLVFSGCFNQPFSVDGWEVWHAGDGEVALIRAQTSSHVIDGVMTIPTHVGQYRVARLGFLDINFLEPLGTPVHFDVGPATTKIVIPAGIIVDGLFWSGGGGRANVRYVELLSKTAEEITLGTRGHTPQHRTVIIPNGTREFYRMPSMFSITFIERTQWEEKQYEN